MQIQNGRRLDLNHHVQDSRQAVEATRCLCHCNCFQSPSARARRKPPIDHRVLARPWFGAANVRPRSLSRADRSAALGFGAATGECAKTATAERTIEISASSVDVNAAGDAVFSGEVEIKLPRGHDHGGERQLDGRRRRRRARAASNFVGPDVTVFGENGHYDEASETMSFSSAGFDLPKRPARGSAEQIEVASDSRVSLAERAVHHVPAGKPRVGAQRTRHRARRQRRRRHGARRQARLQGRADSLRAVLHLSDQRRSARAAS